MRVNIARYLMGKKQFKDAEPYAEEAAQTWAAWAMYCAHDCYQALGDWEKAELWVRRTSERYPDQALAWLYWCLRVGKGDREAARELADELVRGRRRSGTLADWSALAIFYTATQQKSEALDARERILKASRTEFDALLVALAHDDVGDADKRDRALAGLTGQSALARLAKIFVEALAKGDKEAPDPQALDAALSGADPMSKEASYYLIGQFLECRGQKKAAAVYFNRCAVGKSAPADLVLLATIRLREQGLAPHVDD